MSGFMKAWSATAGKWLGLQLDEDQDLKVQADLRGDATTPVQLLKTVATAGTPEKVSATDLYFRTATIYGQNDQARTDNTGDVYAGWGSAAGEQPREITPGAVHVINAPLGQKYNFADLYVDADNNADGVLIEYS